MTENILDPTIWSNSGVTGLALFLLFVFIVLFMVVYTKSNNKNISNLCNKIDKLADTNSETAKKMAEANLEVANKMSAANLEMSKSMTKVFTKVSADQENNKSTLNQIYDGVTDLKASVDSLAAKTETLLELKCRPLNDRR